VVQARVSSSFFDWACAANGLAHAADLPLSPRA
jgi:hypothetical protein